MKQPKIKQPKMTLTYSGSLNTILDMIEDRIMDAGTTKKARRLCRQIIETAPTMRRDIDDAVERAREILSLPRD